MVSQGMHTIGQRIGTPALMAVWPLVLLLALAGSGRAQDIEFTASAPKVVAVGEGFRLSYTVNSSEVQNFQAPRFTDFEASGPSRSTQSQVSIVNGQMTQSVKTSFSYYMRPQKEGTYTIGPASVEVEGKAYTSNEVTIKVVQGQSSGGTSGQRSSGSAGQSSGAANQAGDKTLLRLELSNSRPYQGQAITAVLKMYTLERIRGIESLEMPEFNGFWKQEIKTAENINLEREELNGKIYRAGVLGRFLLFPQQSGDITIEPATLSLHVSRKMYQPSFFDDGFRTVKVSATSPQRIVKVRPLPTGAPPSFNGAVGDFRIDAELDKDTVEANGALSLSIRVRGQGNLKLIDPFEVNFPSDFDVYDPEITQNITNTASGARGSKKFTYLLVPRYAGTFTIPSFELSYFNPGKGRYEKMTVPAQQIVVKEGNGQETSQVVTSKSMRSELTILDDDIRFIKQTTALRPIDTYFMGSWLFWLILAAPVFLLMVFLAWQGYRRRLVSNQELLRTKRAGKVTHKRLKVAEKMLKQGQEEAFYDEVLKALWGYLSDKLNIPHASLTQESLAIELHQRKVADELINNLRQLLDNCEFAKYAPSQSSAQKQDIFAQAGQVIRQLENQLKNN